MFKIKIADIVIEMDNRYSHLSEYCKDFICDDMPDFRARVTQGELEEYINGCGYNVSPEVAERILSCRSVSRNLPAYDAFLLHGGVIEYRGHGIVFSAKRGVGKTTHMNLWQRLFGADVKIINGDKPVIAHRNGRFEAHGTPWRGKEGFGGCGYTTVEKLCFVTRAEKPFVKKLSPSEGFERLKFQTIYPTDASLCDSMAQNIADFLRSVDIYEIGVNMKEESAEFVKNKILTV